MQLFQEEFLSQNLSKMKKQKLPSLIAILILTLITVVIWVSFNVYRAIVSTPPLVVPAEVSEPLNPKLDTDAMGRIESSVYVDESQIPDSVISAQPSVIVTAVPVATPIPTPEPVEEPIEEPLPEI